MASQYNIVHTVVSSPAINPQRIQVNGKFGETAELRAAAERSFVLDGKMVWADGRVSGSKRK